MPDMATGPAATNLKALRTRSGASVRELASEADMPASTYASYEDKFKKPYLPMELVHKLVGPLTKRGISEADVFALGGIKAAPKPVAEPERPFSQAASQDRIPILGMAEGGDDGWDLWNGETVAWEPRPGVLVGVPQAFGVYVTGLSMVPKFEPGDILYIHPGKPVTIGAFVLVELLPTGPTEAPRAMVKRLAKRNQVKVTLEQFNPSKLFEVKTASIKRMLRIVGSGEA